MELRASIMAVLAAALLLPINAGAQLKEGRASQFLPAGRELRQRLDRVKEAVEEQRFAELLQPPTDGGLDEVRAGEQPKPQA